MWTAHFNGKFRNITIKSKPTGGGSGGGQGGGASPPQPHLPPKPQLAFSTIKRNKAT